MNFHFELSPFTTPPPPQKAEPSTETIDLLRQMLDVQREQLNQLRANAAAHDMTSRWRAFLQRWQEEFPLLGENCRKTMPILEQTYARLISDLTELCSSNEEPLDNDFALQEFLDRYGMRLAQLGTILNLVAPLAEAGPPQNESA
jgi:uncharacterized protein YeaO (DUF488 family)